MLFEDYKGSKLAKYDDDKVRILISCPRKASGVAPRGDLGQVLTACGLPTKTNSFQLKQILWRRLNLELAAPIIYEYKDKDFLSRTIDNAGEINILREKEGRPLLKALNLPTTADKKMLDKAVLKVLLSK